MRILILALIFISFSAQAKSKPKNKLGTDFNFDAHSVRGNYLSNNQAVATVENEKRLNKMLQPRKQFKDRIKTQLKLEQVFNQKKSGKKER
ncbi:MAG: hypothetical protein HRT44_04235 [Bdellovibrionales bacterium]|nr:hypothetical protein [Bdellovibrionales bacterium]NQZ18452.1 hypothetical protein [Bdellovibrionales bacterium]